MASPANKTPKRKRKIDRSLSPEQIEMHRALSTLRQKMRSGSLRGGSKAKSSQAAKAKP